MITISQQQALDRWDFLTPELREALFSETNTEFIWKLCHTENLPDDKSLDVAETSGYVVMGFLHPEDLAGELKDSVGIEPNTAKIVADAINARIFAPLRADIDKVYKPISKLEAPVKVFQDIGLASKSASTPTPVPTPKPVPIATSSAQGWSTARPAVPVAPIVAAPKPAPVAKPNPVITPVRAMPSANNNSPAGKFDPMARTGQMAPGTPASTPPPKPAAPATPAPASGPAPFMLHEDLKPAALQQSSDFRLSRPGESGRPIDVKSPIPQPSVRPAILELGKNPEPVAPKKVVHYTEIQSVGPRSVSELTASPSPTSTPAPIAPAPMPVKVSTPAPMPQAPQPKEQPAQLGIPKPPTPPSIPTPPAPPAPGTGRVIKKNY